MDAAPSNEETTPPHAIAAAAADLATCIGAPVIVAFTSGGATAAREARKRPATPILAITSDEVVSRRLCLTWGAHSVRSEVVHSYGELVVRAVKLARDEDFARPTDQIIVVAGIPFGEAGSTDNIRVIQA